MYNFQPQKVKHLKDELKKKNPNLGGTYIITEKHNGWDTYIFYNVQQRLWSTPYSSAMRKIPALEWMGPLLNTLPKLQNNYVLRAECIIPDTSFQIINGILNRSVGDYYCYDIIFKCHDLINIDENNLTAINRYNKISDLLETNEQIQKIFYKTPLLLVAPYQEKLWMYIFEDIINNGGEGIVAKRATSIYEAGKRNSNLIKLKMECEIDCLADRLEETVGEKGNPGLVLICKRKNGIEIRAVISKHEDQDLFLTTPDAVIGKIVCIKGMEELENGILTQPVFQFIRKDKNNEDYQ